MAGRFLNRWSRLKAGDPIKPAHADNEPITQSVDSVKEGPDASPTPPSVSLDDVEKIDRLAPDFSAFMQPGVDPAVQQAALKKMFSDPHFNVMDGLDIYIDDYSKSDPIPLEMLKRMVQSDMLNIFRKEDGSPIEDENPKAASLSDSESPTQSLPLNTKTDLICADPEPNVDAPKLDPTPVDQKTS